MLATPDIHDDQQKWFEGITRYQWVVLIITSLGWMFDVFGLRKNTHKALKNLTVLSFWL